MAEATIYCPSCNRKVRIMEEQLGQVVQCPLCQTVFTSPKRSASTGPVPAQPVAPPAPVDPGHFEPARNPTPQYPDQPDRPTTPWSPPDLSQDGRPPIDVHRALLVPGIALLVSGVLEFTVLLAEMISLVRGGADELLRQQEQNPVFQAFSQGGVQMPPVEMIYTLSLIFGTVLMLFSSTIVLGAVQMLRLRGYWLAVVGSCVAIINPHCVCCMLTLPLGIWSLAVLRLPEVRSAFE